MRDKKVLSHKEKMATIQLNSRPSIKVLCEEILIYEQYLPVNWYCSDSEIFPLEFQTIKVHKILTIDEKNHFLLDKN